MPVPQKPFLTFGLPFIAFMVIGHQALTYIGQGRYDVKDEYQRQKDLLITENRVALPQESIMKAPKFDQDYKIVRLPRPQTNDGDGDE